MVCHVEQTKSQIKELPTIDINLAIAPLRKTSMLVDTGAQVSLISNKVIENKSLINPRNKITITSIHGSEDTLGDISARIHKNNSTIPIQLQVTENTILKEDGILGYDIIGEKAVINGPDKMLTLNSDNSTLNFPIKTKDCNKNKYSVNFIKEIEKLHNIEYLSDQEINPHYNINLQTVKTITRQINQNKIKIFPIKNV